MKEKTKPKIIPLQVENSYKIRITPIGQMTKKIKLRKGDVIYLSKEILEKKVIKKAKQ